ncbi:hypothetical protein SLA2020_496790 [Shorea laevis]
MNDQNLDEKEYYHQSSATSGEMAADSFHGGGGNGGYAVDKVVANVITVTFVRWQLRSLEEAGLGFVLFEWSFLGANWKHIP